MSLFNKKSPAEFEEQDSQPKPKSRGSLVVLLILLGGFAYLYFFTGLIVPHEVVPVKPSAGAPEVKQSMPPKTAAPVAAPTAAAAKKPEEAKPAPPASVAPTSPPAAAKPAAPVPPPAAAKPAAAPAAPAPQPPVAAKPAAAPAAPKKEAAAPVKKEEAKPVKAAEPAAKKEQPKSAKVAPVKGAPVKKAETYTLLVGEFPAGDEVGAVEAKLAKLAIKPAMKHETRKSRSMNRLYFGAYTDYDVYSAELEKLRRTAKGAFGVEKDGKYYLYAGSFSSKESAEKEKKDLVAKGVPLQIQQTVLSLATVRITAGQFSSKDDADKSAAALKAEGVKAIVVPRGR